MVQRANKNDLVIIVGAGASAPCGISTTRDLTKCAFTEVPSEDLRRMLREALRGAYGDANFELLLYALEDLGQFVESTGTDSPAYRPVISAFADLLVRYQPLSSKDLLKTTLYNIVKALHKKLGDESIFYVGHRCTAAIEAQRQFIIECAKRFRVIAIDLNYDTLLDQIPVGWYDGFEKPSSPNSTHEAANFNPNKWIDAYDSDQHLLIHLHGSANFGFANADGMLHLSTFREQVRYDDVKRAQESLVRIDALSGDPPNIANLPIISGFGKILKLASTIRPYGHYHLTALRALFSIPRLMVIGYGGLDDHLNSWIAEHAAIHRERRRAVAILTREGSEVEQPVAKNDRLRILAGPEAWKALSTFAYINDEHAVWFGGHLALAPVGAPEAYAYSDKLLAFLAEAGEPLSAPITSCEEVVAAAIPRHGLATEVASS